MSSGSSVEKKMNMFISKTNAMVSSYRRASLLFNLNSTNEKLTHKRQSAFKSIQIFKVLNYFTYFERGSFIFFIDLHATLINEKAETASWGGCKDILKRRRLKYPIHVGVYDPL